MTIQGLTVFVSFCCWLNRSEGIRKKGMEVTNSESNFLDFRRGRMLVTTVPWCSLLLIGADS